MTAAFRLQNRPLGYLLVFGSILLLMVASHQLFVLVAALLLEESTPLAHSLWLTAQVLGAAGLTAWLMRTGVRRIDG